MFWKNKFKDIKAVDDIKNLPFYSFQFFFKNIGPFKTSFILLTIARIIATLLRFGNVYILSDIISNVNNLTIEKIFYFYLPLVIIDSALAETMDYFTRKYAEALPDNFSDYGSIIIYKKILDSDFFYLFNYSKEKLINLVNRYLQGVSNFLVDWVWLSVDRTTLLVIVIILLYIQSPVILLIDIAVMGVFMFISFQQGKTYARLEEDYSKEVIQNTSILQSFLLNLNLLKRLNLNKFFITISSDKTEENWMKFKKVRDNHAFRWFTQLGLFDFIYTGTIFYGVYQVINKQLPLGFLLLIKWSFDNLWQISTHYIGVYTSMLKQREVAKIVRLEFNSILSFNKNASSTFPSNWKKIKLLNILCEFENTKHENIKINIPELIINRNAKIGIIGESGSGKSTLLGIMLNQIKYTGLYEIDNIDAKNIEFTNQNISIINNNDPFFNISIYDNIALGRKIDNDKLNFLLDKLKISKFTNNLKTNFGDKDINFSSGQLQRLRLIRGLIEDSEIYLLDEPFNGIDNENKNDIISFIKEYLKDKTVILVTHNKEELEFVDKIYKFEGHELISN